MKTEPKVNRLDRKVGAIYNTNHPILFEVVEPLPDENEALREYEEEKKKGTLKLYKLEGV